MQIIFFFVLLSCFLSMVVFLEYLQKRNIAKGEITRKMGHFILGCIFMLLPLVFQNTLYSIILCVSISLIIYISSRNNKLPCADNVARKTHGTYLYPIGVLITLLISSYYNRIDLFYPSIIILMFSDIFAAFIGSYCLKKHFLFYRINSVLMDRFNKTLYGSCAFFLCTFFILILFFSLDNITALFIIALLITLVEFFSSKGYDNLTIPISSIIGLLVFHYNINI